MDNSVEQLWNRFKLKGELSARDELIYYYVPFVERIAHKYFIWLPRSIDYEDLIASGIIGLISAIDRYDVNSDVKFESFAFWRIKGEMIDFLRSRDVLSKGQRMKIKQLEKVVMQLEQEMDVVKEEDIAERMHCSLEEVEELMRLSLLSGTVSLSDPISDELCLEDVIREDKDIVEEIDTKLIYEAVLTKIENLSDKEKKILHFYFVEGLTLKEIGSLLSISESRVSQILSRVLFVLKSGLKKEGIIA